jgi:hypothetical protein
MRSLLWMFGERRPGVFELALAPDAVGPRLELDLQVAVLDGEIWVLWTCTDSGTVLRVLRAPRA